MGIVMPVTRCAKHAKGQRRTIVCRVRRRCCAKTISALVRATMAIIWRRAFVQSACTHALSVCLA